MKGIHKKSGVLEAGFFCFLLFFFIYSVNFTFLPAFSSQLLVMGVVVIWGFHFLQSGEIEFHLGKGAQTVLTLWVILFFWIFLRTLQTGFLDLSFLINITLLPVQVFIGALFLTAWLFKRGFSFTDMIRFIQLIIVIQAVFIVIYFFSWDFKEFTLLFIPEGGNLPALHPYRSRGLTHGAGAKLSALQAIGILFSGYLILKERSWKWVILDILAIVILLASVFMTGRTGFLIIPMLLFFYVVYILGKNIIPKKLLFTGAVLPVITVGGFFLIQFIFQAYMGVDTDSNVFRNLTRWAFGEFQDLGTTGGSRTIDALIYQHWFFPDEAGLFLFGDPNTYELNRVHSDIGIVRRIFGLGFIGLILTYLFVGNIFVQMVKSIPHFTERLLIVFLGLWLFILEFKEPFVTEFRFASVYLMLFSYICLMPLQNMNRFTLEK